MEVIGTNLAIQQGPHIVWLLSAKWDDPPNQIPESGGGGGTLADAGDGPRHDRFLR